MSRRHPDPAVESIRAALKSLRSRNGLTVERLRVTELGLDSLLDLDLVRELERTRQMSPPEAIVAAVRGAAAQLDVADMLIVDAALALGLVAESHPDRVNESEMYAAELGERRRFLVSYWGLLHDIVGASTTAPAPTIRSLRAGGETQAFELLAERILMSSPLDATPERETALAAVESGAARGRASRVLVVGAAVTDHVFVVEHLPEPGTSIQATSYDARPGGKALNQAVAAARLGMEVHLLAALGDDAAGTKLLEYLDAEGVHLDLVRVVPGKTPTVAVHITPDGQSAMIGWGSEAQLTRNDLSSRAVENALAQSDTALMTFEVPSDIIEVALDTAARLPNGPTVVLTASPPYDGTRFTHGSLRHVDYLIGTQWELSSLVPGSGADTPADVLSTQLLMLGAGTVCIAEHFGCTIRSNTLALDVVPQVPAGFAEATRARDAFASALALRLHESGTELTASDATWVTGAMAASQALGGAAMPSREDIDRIVQVGFIPRRRQQ